MMLLTCIVAGSTYSNFTYRNSAKVLAAVRFRTVPQNPLLSFDKIAKINIATIAQSDRVTLNQPICLVLDIHSNFNDSMLSRRFLVRIQMVALVW